MSNTFKGGDPREFEANEKKFITTLSKFCLEVVDNDVISKLKDASISDDDLILWSTSNSDNILKKVIPSSFWKEFKIPKPNCGVSQLCSKSDDIGTNVLRLVLWSCCNVQCNTEIIRVLDTISKEWVCSRQYDLRLFLRTYVILVQAHVWYSMQILNFNGNVVGINEKTPVLKEAYCLHAAVVNSSAILKMLSYNIQTPTIIVNAFVLYLKKTIISNSLVKSQKVFPCVVFGVNEDDDVTHVSMPKWFKLYIICPNLKRLFEFEVIKLLTKKIGIIKEWSEAETSELITYGESVAKEWFDIEHDKSRRVFVTNLIIYIVLLKDFLIEKKVEHVGLTHTDQTLLPNLLKSGLFQLDMKTGLKKLVKDYSMANFNVGYLQTLLNLLAFSSQIKVGTKISDIQSTSSGTPAKIISSKRKRKKVRDKKNKKNSKK